MAEPKISDIAKQLRQTLHDLSKQIEQKQIERHKVEIAPRTKQEVMQVIMDYINQQSNDYEKSIRSQFDTAKSAKSTGISRLLLPAGLHDAKAAAVIWLLRPIIEDRISDALKDDPIYSGAETGLTPEERQSKLDVIDGEIEALKAQQKAITDELSAAGIKVFI
ncbi:hypothetical protein [Methylococcus sp. Mc7]|uniref:hypothetical protein n=1 Tax=Methylococcus sp. Mc7 TaxID=2860258 RepID=UPI001C5278FD|nr:hypothetical protein [Methylococcus sp. Mc7]QXP83014.1 hypothetical protein KW115_12495 [Methylococcus sp. Mc7]